MGWVSGIVVYILTWWTVLFAVLPWGLKRDEMGRPENFNIWKKIIATSLVSVVIWVIIYGLIEADIISFRLMADAMVQEDMTP
jgi:predicted secreted protein